MLGHSDGSDAVVVLAVKDDELSEVGVLVGFTFGPSSVDSPAKLLRPLLLVALLSSALLVFSLLVFGGDGFCNKLVDGTQA